MTYDPRTGTGIPTEPVGLAARAPPCSRRPTPATTRARSARTSWRSSRKRRSRDSIERFEATGSPIISDGEQRWSSFATYPITDTLAGTGLAPTLGPGGQFFAIFADGHGRQLPKLRARPVHATSTTPPTSLREVAARTRTGPMKQAVIAPSMLALLYPLRDPVEGYSRDDFEAALIDECEKDIRQAFAAGAARVSVDFTEGRLATREDPRNPWTGAGLLPHFIELNNRVMARFTAGRAAIDRRPHLPGRRPRLGALGGRAVREPAAGRCSRSTPATSSSRWRASATRTRCSRSSAQHLRDDADGVAQTAYIGVINPQNPRVESPQEIADQLIRAANHIPKEQLGSTDDCGFSPFSIDEKPNHGSPDYAREVAFQKIRNRVEGTRLAAEKLGL